MMPGFLDDPLWHRIERFELDDVGSALTFTRRLARENGWSADFAARVVLEYKRFCYLAFRAGHPVTPSDEVDQAWHLHLAYTRSYWDEFCRTVLGGPLHHGPTKGGKAEGAKYRDWYQTTLESYARVFGETPPPDIWPDCGGRFQNADAFRRINTASVWLVPKPTLPPPMVTVSALSAAFIGLAACVEINGDNIGGWTILVIGIVVLLAMALSVKRQVGRRKGGGAGGGGFCRRPVAPVGVTR